jgi:hypothetical protein
VLSLCLCAVAWAGTSAGEVLYRRGLLPTGEELQGTRDTGASLRGAAAACVNCHRRSGLGSYEGATVVPPIIGRYLFRTRQVNAQDLTLPHIPGYVPNRAAYTDATLADAIRSGMAPGGRHLSPIMPHYALDSVSMSALIAYLRQLSSAAQPGVSDASLDFATIVTPDADPVAAQAMLAVMQRFFAVQNDVIAGEVRPMRSDRDIMYRVTRRWRLHVWRVEGDSASWPRQLGAHMAAEPVFAVISGIGGRDWRPVHAFCEQQSLPCLFPNVDLPVIAEQDFYSLYWSRGVLLEADLIGRALASEPTPGRVVQLFRSSDIGAEAAASLEAKLRTQGVQVVNWALHGDARPFAAGAFKQLHAGDRLVLWLRNTDLAALPEVLAAGVKVHASGLMAGLEAATPPTAWRNRVFFTYPFDMPDSRRVRVSFALGWLRIQHLPVEDERIQVNTYLACQILAEALGHMLDSFVRDFLVERVEMMLSSRLVSGYFPRLGLAPGQRFASKGGYVVHFAGPEGTKIVADGDWTVP